METKGSRQVNRCCIALMSKAPVPGKVKTRLIPALLPVRAASTYQTLLVNTVQAVSTTASSDLCLWCAPDTKHPLFQRLASRFHIRLRRQPVGALGQRMSRIAALSLRDYEQVVILGADCPVIDARAIDQCNQLLTNGVDIVLGATEDGGYVFIGLRRKLPAIFRFIPWSTSRVVAVTKKQARRARISIAVMTGFWDVDTPKDYLRWKKLLPDRSRDSTQEND